MIKIINESEHELDKGIIILTDSLKYEGTDQVFPLYPEHQFFIDELGQLQQAKVLDIGLGSGVLSIAALRRGASHVTGLEINKRAIRFANFNLTRNGLEGKVDIRDGCQQDIYQPVKAEKFDYIISNPPFEPTPEEIEYFAHSAGGKYGLDFVQKLLEGLDEHLTDHGHAQIVTFAPGSKAGPDKLVELVNNYLPGQTIIKVNPVVITFDYFTQRFVGKITEKQRAEWIEEARKEGITHLYLCMLHYEKGPRRIEVVPAERKYDNWDLPNQ